MADETEGANLYRLRCGWCGAYEGTTGAEGECDGAKACNVGDRHEFGRYERVWNRRPEPVAAPEATGWHSRWVRLCKLAGGDALIDSEGWGAKTLATMALVESSIAARPEPIAPPHEGPRWETAVDELSERRGRLQSAINALSHPGDNAWAIERVQVEGTYLLERIAPIAPHEGREELSDDEVEALAEWLTCKAQEYGARSPRVLLDVFGKKLRTALRSQQGDE